MQTHLQNKSFSIPPFGSVINSRAFASGEYRFRFNGMEKEPEINPAITSAEFWMYDGRLGKRWNQDPKPNLSISNYACFANNPIYFSDPFGDTTFVSAGKNGTYTVWDGTTGDNHNGIFIKDKETGKLGNMIGYTATPESFYNSDEKAWMGTINPSDQSGRDFLNNEIIAGDPNMAYYAWNATGGEKYDFKRTNGTSNVLFTEPVDFYRGMPISLQGEDASMPVFASARDVGNIGAGLVSGRAGLSWSAARFGFDFLETKQKFGTTKATLFYPFFGVKAIEGSSTQYGERLGFRIGSQMRQAKTNEQLRRLPSYGGLPQIKVSNSIMIRSDYTPWK